ncbi:MAG: GerMN domain-containing protein [Eubacteriales bacterium]|nr:GerMN domain-containing protein [Eubacteriales bacterium]
MKKLFALLLACLLLSGCASPAPTQPTASPETTVATQPAVPLTLYLPDDNAEKLETKEVTVPALSDEAILEQLTLEGVLNQDVQINTFSADSPQLAIDFNAAFGTLVGSMGTAGETMILGSVVNTFLTAYQGETLKLTVNGSPLETGHSVYDAPLSFYE